MSFNGCKMEDERGRDAEKRAAARRALYPQVKADALRLVAEWNERQARSDAIAIFADDQRCDLRLALIVSMC